MNMVLERSFSVVSKLIFENNYSFCSMFSSSTRFAHVCAVPNATSIVNVDHRFAKLLANIGQIMHNVVRCWSDRSAAFDKLLLLWFVIIWFMVRFGSPFAAEPRATCMSSHRPTSDELTPPAAVWAACSSAQARTSTRFSFSSCFPPSSRKGIIQFWKKNLQKESGKMKRKRNERQK